MIRLPAFCLFGLWMGAASLVATATERELQTVDGRRLSARLTGIDANWQLTFEIEGQAETFPAGEIVAWGAPVEADGAGTQWLLPERGIVVAEILGGDQNSVELDSLLFSLQSGPVGRVRLPMELIRGALFRPPGDRRQYDQLLFRLIDAPGGADRLVLDNGDELSGTLKRLDAAGAKIESTVGEVEIASARLRALALDSDLLAASRRDELRMMVGFGDGSRLIAESLSMADGEIRITPWGGKTWLAVPQDIVFLQPLGGAATYLSDLEPESYRHVPFLDLPWSYHLDRNANAGQLRSGGRLYVKGVGMHSAARLTWPLDGGPRRFAADVALDDSVGSRGSVVFRVFADTTERFASPVIRGGDAPLPVSVDLSGARRVSLIVDFADRGDELDHANWLDARLVP